MRTMRRSLPGVRPRAAAALLALALGLAACGGEPASGEVASLGGGAAPTTTVASGPEDRQEAMLAFTECMREQGIDMPDPQPGRPVFGAPAGDVDPGKLDAAQRACRHLLPPQDSSGASDPDAEDALVAFAECMREQGIDMPDPQGAGGLRGLGVDPNSKEFQEAMGACREHFAAAREGAGGGDR